MVYENAGALLRLLATLLEVFTLINPCVTYLLLLPVRPKRHGSISTYYDSYTDRMFTLVVLLNVVYLSEFRPNNTHR